MGLTHIKALIPRLMPRTPPTTINASFDGGAVLVAGYAAWVAAVLR